MFVLAVIVPTTEIGSAGSTGLARCQRSAGGERARLVLFPRVGGDGDRGERVATEGGEGERFPRSIVAVLIRHLDIRQQHVLRISAEKRQRFGRRRGGDHARTSGFQDRREELSRFCLVVHDHHPDAIETAASGTGLDAVRRSSVSAGEGAAVKRQPHAKGRATALAAALGLHRSTVQLDEVADDRETEAQAAARRLPPSC